MIRTFHPIGQGAFYTEVFNDFTMVYDCGSTTSQSIVEREIRHTFERGQVIDAVFISHLDNDHVNGLEYLMNYCIVQKLFLPLIDDEDRFHIKIRHIIENDPLSPFILSLLNANEDLTNFNNTQVFWIPVNNSEGNGESPGSPIMINDLSAGRIPIGTVIGLNENPEWVFIPFNFRFDSRSKILREQFSTRHIFFNSVTDFMALWSDEAMRSQIKESYRNIPGSLNCNSLTLYSGPALNCNYYIINRHFNDCYPLPRFLSHRAGGIYFGDYEAKGPQKWRQFFNCYEQYWHQIGTVQVPHHGSKYSYNREINQIDPKLCVISCGYTNRHRHPHASTIRDIIVDGGFPIIVTERIGSRLWFNIYGI